MPRQTRARIRPALGIHLCSRKPPGSVSQRVAARTGGSGAGGGSLLRMAEDEDDDEDDDPQPDAYSTLYDPLAGLRERWVSRLNWWQKTLLVVGTFVAVVAVFALLTILKITR